MGEKLKELADKLYLSKHLSEEEIKRLWDFPDEHPMARFITVFYEVVEKSDRLGTVSQNKVDTYRNQIRDIVVSLAFDEPDCALDKFNRHFVTPELFDPTKPIVQTGFKRLEDIPPVPKDGVDLIKYQTDLERRILR